MKSTLIKTGLTLALAGALGLATFAQTPAPQAGTQPPAGHEGKHGGHLGRHGRRGHAGRMLGGRALERLNLTDAQREQLRAIHERYRQSLQPQHEELRQLAQARRGGGTLTPEQQAHAQELHAQLKAQREQLHAELQGVLTAEQREQLKQQHDEFKQHMKERRGQRRPGTPQPDKN